MSETGKALRRCLLFSSFDHEEIEELQRSSRRVSVAPDEVLFREGESGDYFFVILSGGVRIVSSTGSNREQTLAVLGPGESFGEMALLDGEVRSATAAAVGAATLARIDRSGLESLHRSHPQTAAKFLACGVRLLAARLRSGNARFLELARLGMHARAEVERMRSQILSLVSHELRTPLTVIKSSAQVLRGEGQEEEHRRLFVEKIERQSERLGDLVDDVIALALLQAKPGVQRSGEFDPMLLTEEIVAELQEEASQKELRLSLVPGGDGVPMSGDGSLIRRALHHLVANAVKFSPPGGEVRIEAEMQPGEGVRVSVVDQGPGMPADARERLFQPFTQEQDPLTRDVDGLGIGLTLVREVVQAHGGSLLVDSTPGRGSRFTMELPLEPGVKVDRGSALEGKE